MKVLGLDTATRATAVALLDGDRAAGGALELERRDDPRPGERPGHATRLMVLAVELLDEAGLQWRDLDRIAVGLGPGTFTGLRIGIATARGLALAQGTPLVGISTLRSLAMNADTPSAGRDHAAVIAVLDARRGEAFAAAWRAARAATAEPLLAPTVMAPEQLADAVGALPGSCLAIGDGAIEFRAVLERSGASVPEDGSELHRVTAINHCRLATGLQPSNPDEIRPDYLRLPDAEIALRAARKQ
jgi:tRNA threonylcarbamoyladenosine biosynthesis protein TsaB